MKKQIATWLDYLAGMAKLPSEFNPGVAGALPFLFLWFCPLLKSVQRLACQNFIHFILFHIYCYLNSNTRTIEVQFFRLPDEALGAPRGAIRSDLGSFPWSPERLKTGCPACWVLWMLGGWSIYTPVPWSVCNQQVNGLTSPKKRCFFVGHRGDGHVRLESKSFGSAP